MTDTPDNLEIMALYAPASEDVGLGHVQALPAGQRGSGDSQFSASCVDTLDGLGANDNRANSPDDDPEIESMERGALLTSFMAYRLTL